MNGTLSPASSSSGAVLSASPHVTIVSSGKWREGSPSPLRRTFRSLLYRVRTNSKTRDDTKSKVSSAIEVSSPRTYLWSPTQRPLGERNSGFVRNYRPSSFHKREMRRGYRRTCRQMSAFAVAEDGDFEQWGDRVTRVTGDRATKTLLYNSY